MTRSPNYVLLLDHFSHHGPNGEHLCLVFPVMGPSLSRMMESFHPKKPLPDYFSLKVAKITLKQMLQGLQSIHNAGVVHAGS
jgi:serine/threonine-protein kinase SRPK3